MEESPPRSAVSLEIDLQIDPAPEAISAARRSLDDLLEDSVPPESLENVRLLTGELLTNAVRHARHGSEERIKLKAVASAGLVRVEVRDGGPGFEKPSPRTPGPEQDSGWGLYIVERLADRWGVGRDGLAYVWFEIEYATPPP
jgi:anti-sigma regulatory factor (Ser/Thr protein kinase)